MPQTMFVIRSRTSLATAYEAGQHYGPIDLEGVCTTFEAARIYAQCILNGYDPYYSEEQDLPDFNWKDAGWGRWECTTTDGTYVTEWFINHCEVKSEREVKAIRTAQAERRVENYGPF